MMYWIQSVAGILFTFGLVIFLHEFGHFIMCRVFKVRVERFAFGFGPELIGITSGETRFSICAFPLGGFVKPAGENLEDCTGESNEYFSKTWLERLGIVAAGPVMNYVLAFALFFAVVWVRGTPEPSKEPVIGELAQGFPADQAGIKPEDRVIRVGNKDVKEWSELAGVIHKRPEQQTEITLMRGSEKMTLQVTPRKDPVSGNGLIGIMPKVSYTPVGLFGAAKVAVHQCWYWTAYTVKTLGQKIYRRERPDLAGPIGIVQMVTRATNSGFEDLIVLVGLISVAVGFFNILPIPLLDGGHAAMYIWEGISRRRLTLKAMNMANSFGMVVLLSLLVFSTVNDIQRIRQQRAEKKAELEQKAPEKGK